MNDEAARQGRLDTNAITPADDSTAGMAPSGADFSGSPAAEVGNYAEPDRRGNASPVGAPGPRQAARLSHQMVDYPGVNHPLFNDNRARYDAATAEQAYQKVLDWFGQHLG